MSKERTKVMPVIPAWVIPIYETGEVPNLEGFEQMEAQCIIRGHSLHNVLTDPPGSVHRRAREYAVWAVAAHFKVSNQKALEQFEICIVPSSNYHHGQIFAKRKG